MNKTALHSHNHCFRKSSYTRCAWRANVASRALRAAVIVGVSGLAALALPALAVATPTVTLKAKIEPIPGYPHTGNILGAGADLRTEITISGTEYAGGPPPITEIKGYLPKGTKINTKGFTTCSAARLETSGTAGCPKKAAAGPPATSEGFVTLGGERVRENVQVSPFLVAGGGLDFWIEGNTPTKIEKLATGSWSFPSSGPVLTVHVPLVETLPGAPDGAVDHITSVLGGAQKKGKKVTYYGMVPKSCPKGGFRGKLEMSFLGEPTVTASTVVPCPPSGKKHK
jgi:hypothetical protein